MADTIFGWKDYGRMLLKHGFRLPFNYFFNAHLFDLIHKTDTHTWLPKEFYLEKPHNFSHGVLYMTSWSSEIRRSFHFLCRNNLLDSDYIFIDVGCGKGKVCLLWKLLEFKRSQNKIQVTGIDYYEPLIEIAKKNHLQLFKSEGDFRAIDAGSFEFHKLQLPLTLYLYNPFNEMILDMLMKKLPLNSIIIYNNPVHGKTIKKNGAELIHHHLGWHPNVQTSIYIKTKMNQ